MCSRVLGTHPREEGVEVGWLEEVDRNRPCEHDLLDLAAGDVLERLGHQAEVRSAGRVDDRAGAAAGGRRNCTSVDLARCKPLTRRWNDEQRLDVCIEGQRRHHALIAVQAAEQPARGIGGPQQLTGPGRHGRRGLNRVGIDRAERACETDGRIAQDGGRSVVPRR